MGARGLTGDSGAPVASVAIGREVRGSAPTAIALAQRFTRRHARETFVVPGMEDREDPQQGENGGAGTEEEEELFHKADLNLGQKLGEYQAEADLRRPSRLESAAEDG